MDKGQPAVRLNEIENLVSSLIQVRSPNPPGNTQEIAEFIANYLEKEELQVEVVGRTKKKLNVVATIEGKRKDSTLIFNAHIDTVPIGNPQAWTVDPFGGEMKNGKIYGRGSSDCKAGVAAMMLAAKSIMTTNKKRLGNIAFHFVCDEETGGENGTKYLVERGYAEGADAVISGEPCFNATDGLHLDIAAKGLIWLEISTSGKAAHASHRQLGVNAIEKMANIILALQNMRLPHITHKYLGSPTISVGKVKGGTKVNIVPDLCSIQVDRRILPQEAPRQILNQIKSVVEALQEKDPELKADYKLIKNWPPSEVTDREYIVQLVNKTYRRIKGQSPIISGKHGATDMWIYQGRGIPFVHCGPGVSANSHTTDEFAELPPIIDTIQLYTEVIREFIGSAS